jgi:hypothetical protein
VRLHRFQECIDTMAAKVVTIRHQRRCAVEVSPSEVDTGAELTGTVRISCPHRCDLRGQSVSIRDQDGTELARAEFTELDGEAYVTSAVAIRAPVSVGDHVCRAVLDAEEKNGVLHEQTSTDFSFATKAHAANVNVWGLPPAIAAGERFEFKVGIKCSSGCNLAGRQLRVFDHEGTQVAAANLLGDVWPGTSALYFAELEAQAPLAIGNYKWQVDVPGSDSGLPHAAGSSMFTIKVVSPPDHEVTVVAFDSGKRTPIEGAHVLLHPYRSSTDKAGVAKVKVTKGRYRLLVSGFNYIPYENNIDVASDITTRVELTEEREEQEDYR